MKIFNLDLLVSVEAAPSKLYEVLEFDNDRIRYQGYGYIIIDGNAHTKPHVCLQFAGGVTHKINLDTYEKCVEYANTFTINNRLVVNEAGLPNF